MLGHPRLFRLGIGLGRGGAHLGACRDELLVLLPGLLAARFRLAVGKRRVDLRRGIPLLADEVHHFVVAEQHDGAAAGTLGLGLERHQQIDHRANVLPAIGHVAGLHQRRLAAGPLARGVGESSALQDALELGQRAVDVADGDDAPRLRRWRAAGGDEGGKGREDEQASHGGTEGSRDDRPGRHARDYHTFHGILLWGRIGLHSKELKRTLYDSYGENSQRKRRGPRALYPSWDRSRAAVPAAWQADRFPHPAVAREQ
jgi:hypothetical protein